MRDTRALVIHAHVQAALKHSGLDEADFADDVAALYQARTPLHARVIEFRPHQRGVNPYDVRRANAQLLFRMLKPEGGVRLPSDVEEAVVLTLPEPYRAECLAELAARYGLLAAPLPAAPGAGIREQVKSPCELMRKGADAVERIAPMLEDGRIGAEDHPHFADALHALNGVMGCCTTLIAQIAEAIRATAPKGEGG